MAADLCTAIRRAPNWGDDSPRLLASGASPDIGISLKIGQRRVCDLVKTILEPSGVVVEEEFSESFVSWNRDHVVTLLSGEALLPCLLDGSLPMGEITSLVRSQYAYPKKPTHGSSLRKYCIPPVQRLKLSNTCIEGGNIKFFRHAGREGAIIGASSVIFSAQYMEQNRLFPEHILKIIKEDPDRAAQTIVDFVHKKIATDLNIDPSNLLVVEHSKLHIDLELLVDSSGKVFLYDPTLAEQALKFAESRATSRETVPGGTFEYECQTIADYAQSGIFARNKEKLEKSGFQVIGVPGFFNLRGFGDGGQFMNGLLLEDPSNGKKFLLSPSATFGMDIPSARLSDCYTHFLAEPFSHRMKEHGISVVYVNCQGVQGGGLHCLTREERDNWQPGVPQTIPIHSESLPALIPTQFQIIKPWGDAQRQISLITQDLATGTMTDQPVEFDHFGICNLELPVPLEGRLEYSLRVDGKLLDDQKCFVLPGHPQKVNIEDLHC